MKHLQPGGRHALVLICGCLAGCHSNLRTAEPPQLETAFRKVTGAARITFKHDSGAYGKKLYPERMGAGAAFFDANGDGLLDLFLVNGAPLPGHPNPKPQPAGFYLNRGDGTFREAISGSGLEKPGYGMGVAAADVNNDGYEDLYLTRLGGNSLFLGRGDGTFREVTAAAGVNPGGYSTSAAFLDYDRDGLLDLYVCRYVPWNSPKDDYVCRNPEGQKQYCSVHVYPGMEHRLYHNEGGIRFRDVTRTAGMAGRVGRGLAVTVADYDRDGDPDLFVANDETPNFLWQNQGNGRFREIAAASGFAYNEAGLATAGMGLDVADVDGDGFDDVIESDFQGQRKTLYVGSASGFFTPNSGSKGLGDMPVNRLGFGIGFLDFDLDSWPDVFIANGHVNDDFERATPPIPYAQTAQLFRNTGNGIFADASAQLGDYASIRRVGRGVAFGDYDNDGDSDILISNNDGPAALLRNEGPHRNHWLGVRCVGSRSNRSGLGVRLTVTAGGRTQTRETRTASSYLSSSDPRLLFGLGSAVRVDRLEARWPSGKVQVLLELAADRYLELREDAP